MRMLGDLTMLETAAEARREDPPAVIVQLLDNPLTLLVGRVCVALPFLVAGIMKAWAFNIAALVTELGGSASVILARRTWLGAGALGVFTIMTTFLAHRFWDFSGPARVMQMNSFFEHATISASFIFVVVVGLRQGRLRP